MEETPPVSCMCLTYGRPHLLEEAVESFLRQDYRGPKELVIVNDLSDQHLAFEHPEVRIFNIAQRFRTVGEKRNATAALCTHDWLLPWDDDDIYLPWRISCSVTMMEPARAFFTPARGLELNGSVLSGPHSNRFHSSSCFHRTLFDRVGGYPHKNTGEDTDFERKVARALRARTLARTSGPSGKIFYIYRWAGTASYHLSWFNDRDGHERVPDYVAERLRCGSLRNGEIALKPHREPGHHCGFAGSGRAADEGRPSVRAHRSGMQGDSGREVLDEAAHHRVHDERGQVASGQTVGNGPGIGADVEASVLLLDLDAGPRRPGPQEAPLVEEAHVVGELRRAGQRQ
jgi:glycosyl transferase family 2